MPLPALLRRALGGAETGAAPPSSRAAAGAPAAVGPAADPGVRMRPPRLERRDVIVALAYLSAVIALPMIPMGSSGLLIGRSPDVASLATVMLVVGGVSTLWRRRRPAITLALAGPLAVLVILWFGTLAAYVLLFEALWSPIAHGARPVARIATGLGAALSLGLVVLLWVELGAGEGIAVGLLVVTVAVITPMMWGWDVRLHRTAQLTAEILADTEKALAVERAGRAVEQERREIAQDLHDLVAGHLSAVSIHAGLARSLPDAEGRERSLATTQDSARAALRDLRAMIGLLSAADADGSRIAPGTTLSWEVLADRLAVGGDGGEVSIDPAVEDPSRTAPAVRAALLRTGAEAVTNALRHGLPPRTLQVAVDPPGHLRLTSTNTRDPAAEPGTGLGLAAIAHRSRALGGTVDAGPDPDRPDLWRLEVRLPAVPGGDLP
ncbi:histidine kinase [Brachybacterium phenoliresistens]|uniref:histidine kinase n=1 Tax=Brachybacterium phenoliresistens TaxID=396014 RepID=Z9JU29_9MICO|nr:histidine kinase [Brachybacterium phenoliresistens]EWS81301.1 histidine kinase [Brachybacterium phenoliresistens]